ncbi:HTH-like domain-containing protein [Microbulbifer thermotolerans]|nr:HTH-like domain-containing protein [Microbulbifer thermotolerans]
MRSETTISERRACSLVGLSRASMRYQSKKATESELAERIKEIALERRRFGYRRVHQMLRREGLKVNHKKVYRLYHEAGLAVRKRRRRKGVMVERQPLSLPETPNHTWSMDFVMDAPASGRRIKCLTIVDDFRKESLATNNGL